MRTEQELQQLKQELDQLTGFIADFGTQEEFEADGVTFSNDVSDTISWVLKETSTEHFRSSLYLNIDNLQAIAKHIEQRTGKRLEDYE